MRKPIAIITLFGLLFALGCSGEKPPAKRYELKGKVVAVDKRGKMLIISHHEIPGYMSAMTMGFTVKDAWVLDAAKPDAQVQATLVVQGGKSWLEDVVITETPKIDPNAPAEKMTHTPDPGETVPEFALISQNGKRLKLADYRGKTLVLTFIYTRCPLPDYCPLMSENFSKIAKEIAADAALKDSVRLLSISIDPEFDRPDVLLAYAKRYGAGDAAKDRVWDFATGKPEEVRRIAKFFGLNYWQESGQIIHSLVTAVIDGEGKIVSIHRGNDWKPAEILGDIKGMK